MPGAGTISYTMNAKQVTGTNTHFTSIVTDGTPFGIGTASNISVLGRVDGSQRITDTAVTFYSGASATGSNTPYFLSESPVKWTFPSIDPSYNPQLLQNICLMFSFEPNPIDKQPNFQYFGNWTLNGFLQFLTNFYSMGQSTLPIYTQSSDPDPTAYIPLPQNFGIYDFRQLQANPAYSQLFP